MRTMLRSAALLGLGLAMAAGPLRPQGYRFDLGPGGGYSWLSRSLEPAGGNVRLGDGVSGRFQGTAWLLPSVGMRANVAYADRPLTVGGKTAIGDVNLWSGTWDLMLRMKPPAESFTGPEVLPYVVVGAGAEMIAPAGALPLELVGGKAVKGAPFAAGTETYYLRRRLTFAALAGVGTDVRLTPRFALRAEVGDRAFEPSIDRVALATTGTYQRLEAGVASITHEGYGELGLHVLAGLRAPPAVALAAPPPEFVEPAPPVETVTRICFVDPGGVRAMRVVEAIVREESHDTLVVVNWARRPVRIVLPDVPLAAAAPWYLKGEPLRIPMGEERAEFVPFGVAHVVSPGDVVQVGTVAGLPVFAGAENAAAIVAALEAEGLTPLDDLAEAGAAAPAIGRALEAAGTLYVPLSTRGCVVQPLQRVETTRKVRG